MRKTFVLHLMLAVASASAQGVITTTAGITWIFRADGGVATSAPLGNLYAAAVDAAGNVYVADFSNDIVARISPTGALTVVAGNGIRGFSGDGGPAASASLNSPSGVAVDSAGNVYIADTLNHRIRKVTGSTVSTYAGNGNAGFLGDGGAATSARLNAPSAVSVDSSGNLYIADRLNYRIRKVTPGGTISTVAGNGVRGFSGDNGPATAASLSSPQGIFADAAGNVYIADRDNHRIRRVTATGVITTVAGTGAAGSAGDGGPATAAQFTFPSSVFLDSGGNLLVADTFNQRIRRINAAGVISTVAGNGTRAFSGDAGLATSAALNNPQGAVVDAAGNLFIADTFNNRLRRVSGGMISTAAGNGSNKFSGDGGPASSAALNTPQGLASDTAGNTYFADLANHRVRRINAAGVITTVAGTGVQGFSGDGGPAASAALSSPTAVAVDAAGNLYIADTGNNRVRKISPTLTITTAAGTGVAGSSGDGGPATVATLNQPSGVALDNAGSLYISDAGNQRVRRVTAAGNISSIAGNGTPGYTGDNGPGAAAQLSSPAGLAVDSAASVYVADSGNNRIRRITSAGIISTVAGNGTAGFLGDDGPAVNAQLNTPNAVAFDAAGNLLIADTYNHRIRKVTGGSISSVAGNGSGQFSGDGGPATSASLNQPLGVAVDAAGNVWIADTLNDRIRTVLATTPTFTTDPPTLGFSAAAGTPLVGAQNIDISSAVAGLGYTASAATSSGGSWLSISQTSGSLPASLSASVSLRGLAVGTYQGSVTVTVPLASPSTRTVNVSLSVTAASAAQLTVEPFAVTFDVPSGSGNPAPQTLRIANAGTGTLNWRASVAPGAPWLTVSPTLGSAASDSPETAQLNVSVAGLAAGVYSTVVQVASAEISQFQNVAITLLVAQQTQSILLSRNGLYFTGVEGGGAIPPQDFGILNVGQGVMNWTVDNSTISGVSWLSVSPTSGSSEANSLTIPLVDVGANVGALTTGRYSGLVRVLAAAANNSPQLMSVDMNVLPTGVNPGVLVRPTGLIFAAREGSSSPGSQTVRLSTASPRGMEARAGVFTLDPANWLEVRPANIALGAGESKTLTIQPTLGALKPGQYRGSLTLVFNDGTPAQVVNVLFVVVPAAPAAADGDGVPGAFETCVPQKLLAVFRNLANNFASSVGYPNTLEAQVVDDCGSAVANATVVASFSNSDPPVALVSLGNGIYSGNWRPINQTGRVTVTMRALLPPLQAAEVTAQGAISQNPTAPVLFSGGVVNAASFSPAQALAPGGIVSVFGRVLAASQSQATTVPLPTTMAGATMTVGGADVPLFFTSDGQINAQLPFELPPNSRQQVVVKGTQFLTVPETITIAAARPGVFTLNQDGKGQGAILNVQGVLVDSKAPASAGQVVQVFLTGMGPTNPTVPSGRAAPSAEPLARVTTLPVQATVGGVAAAVEFAGLAPGFVGLYQVNVRIPSGVSAGSSVPLVISQAGVASNTVTLALR